MRDLAYALRTLRKAPMASLTIVGTVGLGLGMVAAVFTLLNSFLFRVDQVPNVRELFAVERPRTAEGEVVGLNRPTYEALREETSAFVDVFARVAEVDSRVEGDMLSGALVTGNFFDVLGVRAFLGRPIAREDDVRGGANRVVVLSHGAWSQRFDRDPQVIGRALRINGIPYDVIGVMPEGFRGLMVGAPDFWAPLSLLDEVQPTLAGRGDSIELDVVGRLRPGTSRESALAQLLAWDARRARPAERSPQIIVVPRWGTISQPLEAVMVFTPIFFAFGLVLLIGCANVASLLLARGVSRQREIGVRLSIGATRGQIVRQLLTESVVLALAGAVLGYGISRALLEAIVYSVMTTMPPDIGDVRLLVPGADWRVAVFLGVGAIVATALFGLVPALQSSRLELIRTIRGEIGSDARPSRARNWLIGAQVTASALLLICAAVFLRGALDSSTADPGLRTSDTLMIDVNNEPVRQRLIDAVRRDPLIATMAASWPPPPFGGARPARVESAHAKSTTAFRFASPEYFSVLDIDLLHGRGFMADEISPASAVVIVAESLARQLWPAGNAVGQELRLIPDPIAGDPPPHLEEGRFTVVGVARDVNGVRLGEVTSSTIYVPISAAAAGTMLTVRAHGDPDVARRELLERLTLIDPNLGQIATMKTVAGMATYFLQLAFWITVALGGIALVLTLSGLFSVLSYLVEQRRKEIGVRMALGATASAVSRLVFAETFRPVGVGLAVGVAVAGALASVLLASPAAESIGMFIRVLDPLAYAAGTIVIMAACAVAAVLPALQASRVDPVTTLRQD